MPTITKRTPGAKRGRPARGILETHQQTTLYLPPELLHALDRQADREQQATGRYTSRADVMRAAIVQYLKAQEAAHG
jgi:Arc/MetJ-type ribon-helix-helix transcriptional regulator